MTEEQIQYGPDHESGSTSSSATSAQNGPLGSVSMTGVQEGDTVRDAEVPRQPYLMRSLLTRTLQQPALPKGEKDDQCASSPPETTHNGLVSGEAEQVEFASGPTTSTCSTATDQEAVDPRAGQTNSSATHSTATTTEVDERKSTDGQKGERSLVARNGSGQPRKTAATSRTPDQQQYDHSLDQGGPPKNTATSAHQKTFFPPATESIHNPAAEELTGVRDELRKSTSLIESKDHDITSLTDEVAQLKGDADQNAQKLKAALKRVEKLEGELSTSISNLTDLQNRHDEQSHELATTTKRVQILQDDVSTSTSELAAAREELKTSTRSIERKNHAIATLTEQLEQSKNDGADKAKQLATAHERVQQLQNDLSSSTTRLAAVNDGLHKSTLSGESKDRTIISLKDELKEWTNAGAGKDKQVAVTLQQVEKLKEELSVSASQLVEIRGLYGAQSRGFTTVREQLKTTILAIETKDRTIGQLEAKVTQSADQVRESD